MSKHWRVKVKRVEIVTNSTLEGPKELPLILAATKDAAILYARQHMKDRLPTLKAKQQKLVFTATPVAIDKALRELGAKPLL